MTRPQYWIVWVNGTPYRYVERAKARGFALIRKAQGDTVTIESKGY